MEQGFCPVVAAGNEEGHDEMGSMGKHFQRYTVVSEIDRIGSNRRVEGIAWKKWFGLYINQVRLMRYFRISLGRNNNKWGK